MTHPIYPNRSLETPHYMRGFRVASVPNMKDIFTHALGKIY